MQFPRTEGLRNSILLLNLGSSYPNVGVAQWIRLRLQSCHTGFKSKAHHLRFYKKYGKEGKLAQFLKKLSKRCVFKTQQSITRRKEQIGRVNGLRKASQISYNCTLFNMMGQPRPLLF